MDSLGMYGAAMEDNGDQILNNNRPALVQSANRSELSAQKQLHIEFETNPLNTNADYRIQAITQSLEITYDAMTINGLIECFHPGAHRDLKGVKKAAYSIYTDIRHQVQFLLNYNIRHIKGFDINIDCQSVYFLLPENGVYRNECSAVCLDFGHFIVQDDRNQVEKINEEKFEDAQSIVAVIDPAYISLKVRLEDIRLLYAKPNEDWKNIQNDQDSKMHLIRPFTLGLDVLKCLYVDDAVLPLWKIDAQVSVVNSRLSDQRLLGVMQLIRSIPFPQSQQSSKKTQTINELFISEDTIPEKNTKKLFETVENMTPVQKNWQKTQNTEEEEENDTKKNNSGAQLTEVEATLEIPHIDFLIEESLSDESDETEPFVRISLVSFAARAIIKTFDIDLDASLTDLIVVHEQFLTDNNEPLRLLSTTQDEKLLSVKCLLTSSENPLFYSAPYNRVENKVRVHISKPVTLLQVEALVSILRFRNDLMEKIPKQQSKTKINEQPARKPDLNKDVKTQSVLDRSTTQIEADLEQFRMIVGTDCSQILDIQLQGLMIKVYQSTGKTAVDLILNDFRALDLHAHTRYRNVIVQQGHGMQMLHVDFALHNYSKTHKKKPDEVDYDIKIHLTKMNIVLLYKYVDLILNVFNALKMKKTKQANVSSTETNTTSDTMQPFQKENLKKIRFNITLDAPTILIPIDSHSHEGIFIDLGQLTLKTHLFDDADRSHVEQQVLIFKNLLASRVNLNNNNEFLGDIILLQCAEFHAWANRLLYPNKIQNQPEMSVKVEWETIDVTMSKDDYSCLTKILDENFSEKISHKIPQPIEQEQVEDEQTNEDKVSSNVPIEKQTNDQISEKVQFDFEIKKIALTLFLDESNLTVHRASRSENSAFLNMRIETIEAHFQQLSDSSYNAKAQIQSLFLDDLRETNPPNSETRLFNRNFNVNQNAPIFITTLDFKPNNQTPATGVRDVNAQLESFYLWLSPDCLMALKEFFTWTQPLDNAAKSELPMNSSQPSPAIKEDLPPPAKFISKHHPLSRQSSDQSSSPSTSSKKADPPQSSADQVSSGIETRVNVLIQTPQICWLEDQHSTNSNCLVFDFFFQMQMIIAHGETHMYGSVKRMSVYTSTFAELKDSKIQYHILQPMDADITLFINSAHQNFDIRIGEIAVNIAPAAIHTIFSITNAMSKSQTTDSDKKEKINSKSLFDPKPFKDASFWFLEGANINQEMIEQTDVLEITTGIPSHKKDVVEGKNKQKEEKKKNQTENRRSQQLNFNLKLIEIKLELGSGSTTKSVIAICLSDLSVDIKNWSKDMTISSRIQIELALFNDNILAWEPLIGPIVDERGEVISPWSITCSTIVEEDENQVNIFGRSFVFFASAAMDSNINDRKRSKRSNKLARLGHHRESLSTTEEQSKDIANSLNAKNRIHIRAEYLLSVTLTKTTIDLVQRLSAMFMDAYKKEVPTDEDIDDESVLSVHNMTGYEVLIDDINGVECVENNKSETPVNLKHEESLSMTVPAERLSATHLPAIAEQIAKRRQEFSIKIGKDVKKVDINHTWKRVYELGPSSIHNWPIQMLCDSQIYSNRRRVILSSIIKIYNRTIMPLAILDVDSVETKKYHTLCRLEVNGEYYLPIQPLYMRLSPRLFIGIDENDSTEQINDFISFDWTNETTLDRILKTKNNGEVHLVIYKESIEAYSENTDEPIRTCFHIYIKLALHLINLLPIDVQCSIDNNDPIDLKTSELYHSTSGNKKSVLIFTLPSYNNTKWTSEPIDLNVKSHGSHNEHIAQFHGIDTQDKLGMIVRVDTYRESFRASLYSPFWILNCTNLKFEFKIENDTTVIDVCESTFFVAQKNWTVKCTNIRICISITTSSFGMSKIIKLLPSVAIINKSTIEIEVIETVSGIEQGDWQLIKPEQIIPFWPHDIKEGIMCVRYAHNRTASSTFLSKDKHRTLLRMNDEDRPALHVETGDAPVLLVNCLRNQPITYGQKEDNQTELLSPQHYVYYTWNDPFKPHQLFVSCNGQNTTIELHLVSGYLETANENRIFYAVFHDGPQTVLIFADEESVIKAVSDYPNAMSSSSELMDQYIEISLHEIGISVINDITREDILYITVNKSKEIWTETRQSLMKPLSRELNHRLEKKYKTHTKHHEADPNDKRLAEKKYNIGEHRHVSFNEDIAEISDQDDHRVRVKRQALDGLWIGCAWSVSSSVLHVRINHIQIDDQLEYTMFPVAFHPIVSKAAGTDTPGKPFIELSVFKTTVARSKTVYFKYFKLLVQECVFCADQGLIVSLFAFIKPEKILAGPTINMDTDLKSINKSFETLLESQVENQSEETTFYFDCIHLSPLKVHVSFSVHGTKPSELLLVEYPLAEFLLQLLNIAEVEDVILKLNFYEREKDRFTITKLETEIIAHYTHQLLKQIHVVVLGLDVLGNPFGVVRGVADGVKSFFYEPYKGATEGPLGFIEGAASGTEHLIGSAVGGAAGAASKITGVISKGLTTLTFDEDYESARIQRKELATQTTSDIVQSGKNVFKDVIHGVKGVVKMPMAGAKEDGAPGFMKGLGKGFIGLVARPTSGVADLTSTSLDLIKRTATQEGVVHRIQRPRHVGRDAIVRPSIAYEMKGLFIFNRLDMDKYIKSDDYTAHIDCSESGPGWLLATSKNSSAPDVYEVEWHLQYKELKGPPVVKFDPDQIEILLKEPKVFRRIKKDHEHNKTIDCQNVGEARYIVDKVTETMHAMEL